MALTLIPNLRTDAARGVVQLAPADFAALGLTAGQTVEITADGTTYGRAVPGVLPAGQMSMDRATAANCGATGAQPVTLKRSTLAPLTSLRLAAATQASTGDLLDALFDMAVSTGDRLTLALPGTGHLDIDVQEAGPEGAGLVGTNTTIVLEAPPLAAPAYAGIAGLDAQIARVHDMIATPLLRPDLFAHLGIDAPRGVLFVGPPGSGKTLLARAVADRTNVAFFQIDGPEILSKHYGDSEAALRRVFAAAAAAAPAIIFIDEIDAIAPRRAELSAEKQVERRVVAQLLTLLDGLRDRGRIVVMAATNLPDGVDPALRRPGRLDREIVFGPPDVSDRRSILALHLGKAPLASDVDLDRIAEAASGYVGADLAALAREAAMAALARCVATAGGEAQVQTGDVTLTQADLETALSSTAPSRLRGTGHAATPAAWHDIGGLEAVKASLQEAVIWPRRHAEALKASGLQAPRGILLSGPPGTGKTLLARALAGTVGLNFIPVRAPEILSQFLGQAERAIADAFAAARATAPSLLFLDEIDAIAPRRGSADPVFDRVVAQILMELDGTDPMTGVTLLAATNRPAALDPALTRPGRFERVIDVPLPERAGRRDILATLLAQRSTAPTLALDRVAAATEGASGADLAFVVDHAAWSALRRAVSGGSDPAIADPEITGPDNTDPRMTEPRITDDDLARAVAALAHRRKTAAQDFLGASGGPA